MDTNLALGPKWARQAPDAKQVKTPAQKRKSLPPEWSGTVPVGDQIGAVSVIILKLYFTNPKRIPKGIRQVTRLSNVKMDSQHAAQAINVGQLSLAKVGRLELGRVTTGERMIDNLPQVSIKNLRRGLARHGLALVDIHYFQLPKGGDRPRGKYVVCLTFRRPNETNHHLKLGPKTRQSLKRLEEMTWMYAHVSNNQPLNDNASIGLVSLQPDNFPQHALVVRDGKIQAISTTNPAKRKQE